MGMMMGLTVCLTSNNFNNLKHLNKLCYIHIVSLWKIKHYILVPQIYTCPSRV
jgi:hypothetical protein